MFSLFDAPTDWIVSHSASGRFSDVSLGGLVSPPSEVTLPGAELWSAKAASSVPRRIRILDRSRKLCRQRSSQIGWPARRL